MARWRRPWRQQDLVGDLQGWTSWMTPASGVRAATWLALRRLCPTVVRTALSPRSRRLTIVGAVHRGRLRGQCGEGVQAAGGPGLAGPDLLTRLADQRPGR